MTKTVEITETDNILVSMFTENTGRHFLDSGDYYGRNWQRNAGSTVEDFLARPNAWFSYGGCVTVDLFHWLRNRLDYNSEIDAEFSDFVATREDTYYLEDMEEFAKVKAGDNWRNGYLNGSYNSYNGEESLSQTIQFIIYTDAETDEDIILLQIHGGADVRGGYTAPKAFTFMGYDVADMLDWSSYSLYCTREPDAPPQTETLDIAVTAQPYEYHYYDVRDCEVTDWKGSYVDVEFAENPDGDGILCPECGALMGCAADY